MSFWKDDLFTADNALHLTFGAAFSAILIPAIDPGWESALTVPLVSLVYGILREQTQFAIKKQLKGWRAWVGLFSDGHRLLEGAAWSVGAACVHLPLAFFS